MPRARAGGIDRGSNEPRSVHVRSGRRFVRLPEGMGLVLPTRIGPFITTPMFSPAEKLRMGLDLLLLRDREPRRYWRRAVPAPPVRRRAGPPSRGTADRGCLWHADRHAESRRGGAAAPRGGARASFDPACEPGPGSSAAGGQRSEDERLRHRRGHGGAEASPIRVRDPERRHRATHECARCRAGRTVIGQGPAPNAGGRDGTGASRWRPSPFSWITVNASIPSRRPGDACTRHGEHPRRGRPHGVPLPAHHPLRFDRGLSLVGVGQFREPLLGDGSSWPTRVARDQRVHEARRVVRQGPPRTVLFAPSRLEEEALLHWSNADVALRRGGSRGDDQPGRDRP